jgi:hypothetical protein
MPYVPPHLRGGSSEKAPATSSAPSGRSASYNDLASHERSSGGRGDGLAPRRGPGLPRTPSTSSVDGLRNNSRRGGPVAAVIGRWEPSERVKALNEEQVAEIRQRLNVDVEVPPGQPPAPPPIESFKDMVSLISWATSRTTALLIGRPVPTHHPPCCPCTFAELA